MDGGGVLPQPLDEVGPVVNYNSSGLGHAKVKVIQGVQHRGFFRPVPQDTGLVVIEPMILRQSLDVPGPELADGSVQKFSPFRRPCLDEGKVLRAEEHSI